MEYTSLGASGLQVSRPCLGAMIGHSPDAPAFVTRGERGGEGPMPLTTLEPGQEREALRARWRAAGWYQDLTVGEAIAAGARQCPDDELIFVSHGGEATTVRLATLHERALDVVGRLYRAGVRPGEVVVLQAAVGPASTEVAMALWALGAVPVLLVAAATPGELAHVLAETSARTVVAARRWRGAEVASSIAGQRQALGLDRPSSWAGTRRRAR